jgi:hypothetical protein
MVVTLITKDIIDWINQERLKLKIFSKISILDYCYIGTDFYGYSLNSYTVEKIVSFEEFQQIVNKQIIVDLW